MARFLEPIRSTANERVRSWVRLHSGRRRREAGRFLIDGLYETLQALEFGAALEEILCREEIDGDGFERLKEIATTRAVPLRVLSAAALAKVSLRQNPDGIVGIGITPDRAFVLPEKPEGPIVVATRLEKPGNLGALIRTAYAAGAAGVVLCDPAVDFENPQVIRSSRGLVFCLSGWVTTSDVAIRVFRERAFTVLAADKNATENLWEIPFDPAPVFVLGEEHDGLPELWNAAGIRRVCIPMREGVDSLNVSVSGALLLYEWRRRQDSE